MAKDEDIIETYCDAVFAHGVRFPWSRNKVCNGQELYSQQTTSCGVITRTRSYPQGVVVTSPDGKKSARVPWSSVIVAHA